MNSGNAHFYSKFAGREVLKQLITSRTSVSVLRISHLAVVPMWAAVAVPVVVIGVRSRHSGAPLGSVGLATAFGDPPIELSV